MKKLYKSFIMALSMFTIIPTPYVEWDDEGIKNMMKFYPAVGLIVGCIWSIVYTLMNFLNCPLILKTTVVMIVPFVITGMLHLDGFMDVCDAVLSRRDKEEKLRILKDSTIGAFAVVSIIMLFFLQFSAVYSFMEERVSVLSLILIPVLSRTVVAYCLFSIVTIKESTLGTYFKKGTGTLDKAIMIILALIIGIISFYVLGYKGLTMCICICIGIILSVFKCIKEFGGISGDVSGFALVVGELAGLIGLIVS